MAISRKRKKYPRCDEPKGRDALLSKTLDAEWDARSRVLASVAVIVLTESVGDLQQYQLDDLRVRWSEYQDRQRERQEIR